MYYFDYAASSPPFPQVIRHISDIAGEAYGNPGALHRGGSAAREILQKSRIVLAQAMNVRPEEIFFTSGGTEANNWAVHLGCSVPGKKHIVCFSAEHSSVLEPLKQLEQKGYNVTYLSPNAQGILTSEAVAAVLRPDTALLCVQAVNNETGVMQDVDTLSRVAKKHRVPYFCDGVQSFGHADQNLSGAQLISLSAHKFGGPRGVGCLAVRYPLTPRPLIFGGGQEFGQRSGTENIPGIAGLSLAARLSRDMLADEACRLAHLRDLLEQGLRRICPDLEIAGEAAPRTAISSCRFPGISAEEMVTRLDLAEICASPGAACAARSGEPSHVLRSMGYSPGEAAEFVRFSLGRNTTEAEIHYVLTQTEDIIKRRH